MTPNDIEHINPAVLASVRTQVDATTTMHKYFGEIRRNADAAWVLCGKCEGGKCMGAIPECPFRYTVHDTDICDLKTIMGLMGI